VVGLSAAGTRHFEHDGMHMHMLRRPNVLARRGRAESLWIAEPVHWSLHVQREIVRLGPFDLVYAAETGGDAALYARHPTRGPLATNLQMSLVQMLQVSPGMRLARVPARSFLQRRLERFQTERSGAIVACSTAILDWTRRLWSVGDKPSVVLPNTTDVARARRLARAKPPPDFPGDGPVVAFSGRLEARKGAHVLVEAMREVWRAVPEARLVMIGADLWSRPPMAARLRALAGRHVDRLHLLGERAHEAVFPALAAADVVALPSLWEAFGIAALEAMAIGCPVVLTRGSGFDDFATHGSEALMVAPGDAEELAEAIKRLLRDPALAQRLATGAGRRAEGFDVEPVAELYAETLPALAARG
jgi:glycosyltransferase involved in cell wall biosynthesis